MLQLYLLFSQSLSVSQHPISGRTSLFLHLGMTGGVLEKVPSAGDASHSFRLLEHRELQQLCMEFDALLERGAEVYTLNHAYAPGDCVFIDNLAIAHRASTQAHGATISLSLSLASLTYPLHLW